MPNASQVPRSPGASCWRRDVGSPARLRERNLGQSEPPSKARNSDRPTWLPLLSANTCVVFGHDAIEMLPCSKSTNVRLNPVHQPRTVPGIMESAVSGCCITDKHLHSQFDSDPSLHGRPLTSTVIRRHPVRMQPGHRRPIVMCTPH
jgi:hypothetical protein